MDPLRLPELREHAAALRAARRYGIEITCQPASETRLGIGRSRLGGRPDLPTDYAWPSAKRSKGGRDVALPLAFVGQVALEDVVVHDRERLLPTEGVLSFFILDEVRVSREVGWDDGEHAATDRTRVLFFPVAARLRRRDPPVGLPESARMPVVKPAFRCVSTWPQCEGNVIGEPEQRAGARGSLALGAEAWRCWAEHAPPNPPNLLLGHATGCEYPVGREPDARLLLSLEARSTGLPWGLFGRNGHLFVRIPQRSLEKREWGDATHKEW
jgi:hypothetical protein